MRQLALALLLGLSLAAGAAQAKLIFESLEGSPLLVKSDVEARKLLVWGMGQDLYEFLQQRNTHFNISFESQYDIAQYTVIEGDGLKQLGGLFERDSNGEGTFTIHINTDFINREVERQAAADKEFPSLPPQKQNYLKNIGRARLAVALIAHEGFHAFEMENHRLEISSAEVPDHPRVHRKIAIDKYDEYYAFLQACKFLAPEKAEANAKESVDGNAGYKQLEAKNLVVRDGKVVETPVPFDWDAGEASGKRTDASRSSFNNFVSDLANPDKAQPQADAAPSGDATPSGDELSAAEIQKAKGLDLSGVQPVCGEGGDTSRMAGGSDGELGESAAARTKKRGKQR